MIEREMVEVVHVILQMICVLILRTFFSNSVEHVFFEILIPKVKPIAIGIFYRPPNENDFLNIFSNDFQQIDSKTNAICLLGDFNINLLQNGRFLLKENQSYKLKSSSSVLVNKYKEFCQKFSLTEIIKEPTRITCSTSTLCDHIFTNSAEKASQKGVIDVGISDHQLIYCTRKIKRIKHNVHNQIQFRSLKKYSAEIVTNALKKDQFPNYSTFSNVNVAYSDLLNKISDTIDRVPPIKEIIIKNNTQEWFDEINEINEFNEIVEAIKIREKYFKKFKKIKSSDRLYILY